MDGSAWDIIRSIMQFLVLPLIGVVGYFFKSTNIRLDRLDEDMALSKTRIAIVEVKVDRRLDNLELDVVDGKTRLSVVETKVDDVREDIKEIKRGIEKLIDRAN
jgi:hypothetical protein